MNDHLLEQVTEEKDLGVIIDNELKFHKHTAATTKKVMAYCRYGRVCCLVKLRISLIRTFLFGNISHITLYAQLEIV